MERVADARLDASEVAWVNTVQKSESFIPSVFMKKPSKDIVQVASHSIEGCVVEVNV